jgi:hypothetical protein
MPTRCVYCPSATTGTEPAAHAFPEAIVATELLMPPGSVCDSCNKYFGTTLDPAVVSHPMIALSVQMLDLPGKRGPRKKVGPVARLPDGSVVLDVPEPTGDRVKGPVNIEIRPDHNFDVHLFTRAIHYLAFNTLVLASGVDHALKRHFDVTRDYIRRPRPRELWAMVGVVESPDSTRQHVAGRRAPEAPGEGMCIRLFNLEFYVDLLNRGALELWGQDAFGDAADISNKWNWPRRRAKTPGPKRFRLRITRPE